MFQGDADWPRARGGPGLQARRRGRRGRRGQRRRQQGRGGRGRGGSGRRARERLGRNITLVLDNLLQDYESSRPPLQDDGRPAVVKTNILIRSMGPVSELGMDYSMDCYFRQYWRDARLSFRGPIKSLSLSIKMLERIWRPDTYFYNGKQSYVHTITVPNKLLRLSSSGDITYSMRRAPRAQRGVRVAGGPRRRQRALRAGDGSQPVRPDGRPAPQLQHPAPGRPVLGAAGQLQPPPQLGVLPDPGVRAVHAGGGAVLGITTVLTLSTISLDSRKDLPKVRHATALDWFLLMSFLYCFATLLQFAAVHYFTKLSRPPPPPRPWWRQALLCLAGDEAYRRQRERAAREQAGDRRHVNSVSRIDRAARLLFPASFGLLNLAYWLAFGAQEQRFAWDANVYLDH
ncbi:hypothetical protein ONE63_003277 [Megalurothrips usitatus]|uniref:Gamma-aminobutyric acid receptor alpha-like n=1 Tax=Megalurothrips usitatus TaxID=439358 RepID=A0AAV7X986_9NEOP|nr:hypothetical protein ONE63_003277 [Megalurothrips usitatus]